jgi:hypothetical protein
MTASNTLIMLDDESKDALWNAVAECSTDSYTGKVNTGTLQEAISRWRLEGTTERHCEHLTVRMGPLNPEKPADAVLLAFMDPEETTQITMRASEIGFNPDLGLVAVRMEPLQIGDFTPREMMEEALFLEEQGGMLHGPRVVMHNFPLATDGRTPHITIAVNRETGGKPFLSNQMWGPKGLRLSPHSVNQRGTTYRDMTLNVTGHLINGSKS